TSDLCRSLFFCFKQKTAYEMLSGYRVFSRRFVKSFPALATGFETETEFTIHALELRMPIGELVTRYRGRVTGSRSNGPSLARIFCSVVIRSLASICPAFECAHT